MCKEQFDLLVSEMDNIVAAAEKYPQYLRPTIVSNLCKARLSSQNAATYADVNDSQSSQVLDTASTNVNGNAEDWDYRRGLDQLVGNNNLNLKSLYDYQYGLIVAHVLQFLSPAEYNDYTITTDHVNDAWRHADRDLPNRPRQPLNDAAKKGLLENAKGKPGFTLTPKGENYVKKLLANGDSS